MGLTVRSAGFEDADALCQMMSSLQALHAEALPALFKPSDPIYYTPANVLVRLARPSGIWFIAHVDGSPAGYIYLTVHDHNESVTRHRIHMLYVEHIFVAESFRRYGVGAALIAEARKVADERGIPLGLDVWSFNQQALNFFDQQGFKTIREILFFEQEPTE